MCQCASAHGGGGGRALAACLHARRRSLTRAPPPTYRVVTGYPNIARAFFSRASFEHVVLLSADGALEAAPAMGSADIILDLVSTGVCTHAHGYPLPPAACLRAFVPPTPSGAPCLRLPSPPPPHIPTHHPHSAPPPPHRPPPPPRAGVTLRENNLREIDGGRIMESQGVLVANRRALLERKVCARCVCGWWGVVGGEGGEGGAGGQPTGVKWGGQRAARRGPRCCSARLLAPEQCHPLPRPPHLPTPPPPPHLGQTHARRGCWR